MRGNGDSYLHISGKIACREAVKFGPNKLCTDESEWWNQESWIGGSNC